MDNIVPQACSSEQGWVYQDLATAFSMVCWIRPCIHCVVTLWILLVGDKSLVFGAGEGRGGQWNTLVEECYGQFACMS